MLFNFDQPLSEKNDHHVLTKEQDERRHRLAGLAVDAILKCSATRRSADNITAVTITFDHFYHVLDNLKQKNHANVMDYDVIEMQNMIPLQPHMSPKRPDSKNVIYIENDDVLDVPPDEADYQEQVKTQANRKSQISNLSVVSDQSPKTAGLVLGDTGDHHFH